MAYSPITYGIVSTANSTTANLGPAAVFSGTSEDVTIYSSIRVSVFSSHASATDGLSIEQSMDGTNWDIRDVYSVAAATGKIYQVAVSSRYFRLVYTNGDTLTTSLRIQVLYNTSDKTPSSVRPQDARPNDNDMTETLSYPMGYNGATWDRLRIQDAGVGNLRVTQYDGELSLGLGMTSLRDLTVAQRYTTWGDSMADGISTEWIQSNLNGATVTFSGGEAIIQTSANAAGSSSIYGPIINYLPGQVDWVNSAVRMDAPSAGNTRRWGRFTTSGLTPQDGFAFELIDTTFYATSFKGGVATRVASTSWTKFSTAPFTLDLNYLGAEIRFTSNSCQFYINNVLRHTASGGAAPITNTLNLPIAIQNINSSGASNRIIDIRNIGQGRFGTQPHGSLISAGNSSTTTLASNGIFTGIAIDITEYEKITVTLISNVASATDGLSMQQSMDGTNWDLIDTYTIPAGSGRTFSVPKQARFFRVVYTNGGTIQGSFRLQTILSSASKASSNKPSDGYTNEVDLEQNQTFPMLYNGTTWDRTKGTSGSTHTSLQPLTTGGLTTFHLVSAASTNATNIKAAAGQVFGWYIYNSNAAARKVVFHNTAGTPTAGASVFFSLIIPPTAGANVEMTNGIAFSTGIAITTVTGLADNDTAAVALNDLIINIFYK